MKEINKNITLQEKEGLTISPELIREADLGANVFIIVKRHLIMIRPRSLTEKMKGIIRNATLTLKELDELYFQRG